MFMALKVSQLDIDVFLMNHDPYHPWSGIFTYINYTWMDMDGMGDEHLKLQHVQIPPSK